MQQKEDFVHQSDQPVLNSPKWLKKLTIILTSVLLLTMFGLGEYWLGARQQRSSSTDLLTRPKSSWFASGTPARQLSPSLIISPTSTPVTAVTDWETYKQDYLWEIKYPMEWNRPVDPVTADYVVFSDSIAERAPNTGYISVQIVWGKKGYNDELYDEILTREVGAVEKGYKLTATVVEKLKIDGYPAIKLIEESTSNAGTEYSYEVAVYIKGPFNVRISAASLKFLDKP